MANFNYIDVGLKDYKDCWDYQEELLKDVSDDKRAKKEASEKNHFLLVEHPHVYTLGKSGLYITNYYRDEFKYYNTTL